MTGPFTSGTGPDMTTLADWRRAHKRDRADAWHRRLQEIAAENEKDRKAIEAIDARIKARNAEADAIFQAKDEAKKEAA